jgi:hypothetical protein
VEEGEHDGELLVEGHVGARQAVPLRERAHLLELDAALLPLLERVQHAQPRGWQRQLHRRQLARGALERLDEVADRRVALEAFGVLDGEEAQAAVRVALEALDGGAAPPLQRVQQLLAQIRERRHAAGHLIFARANEDDGRAGGVDLDRLEVLDDRLDRALKVLLQLE